MPTSESTWQAAINAVQSGMSYREAKHRYGLGSVQALRLRCLGEVAVIAQRGRKPQYLTPVAEAGIVEAIAAKKEAAAAKRAAAEVRKREGPFTPFRASVAKQGTAAAQSVIATTTANAQNIGYIEFLL